MKGYLHANIARKGSTNPVVPGNTNARYAKIKKALNLLKANYEGAISVFKLSHTLVTLRAEKVGEFPFFKRGLSQSYRKHSL